MDPQRYPDTAFGSIRRTAGRHRYLAYIPNPIPRSVPFSGANLLRLADAEAALGRLAAAGRLLRASHLLVHPFLRREAVASTRIEGNQASLAGLFEVEASGQPAGADVTEAANCVEAMTAGLRELPTLSVSVALIREIHSAVVAGASGQDRQPGELRTTQNWIGPPGATIETATFVPPPPSAIGDLLDDLERFIEEDPVLPPLVQAALLQYQFETIHPFLHGNATLGRLLIVMFLTLRERLPDPLLGLSPYFERHGNEYSEALASVRERGDPEGWLALFLDGVRIQATDALARAQRLTDLHDQYLSRVRATTRGIANQVAELAIGQPILTARTVETRLGVSRPASLKALRQLANLGILTQAPRGPRGQLRWRAEQVLAVLADE
ncbi:MAG: Fic family protein [Acidimicrobiales bacterium]